MKWKIGQYGTLRTCLLIPGHPLLGEVLTKKCVLKRRVTEWMYLSLPPICITSVSPSLQDFLVEQEAAPDRSSRNGKYESKRGQIDLVAL